VAIAIAIMMPVAMSVWYRPIDSCEDGLVVRLLINFEDDALGRIWTRSAASADCRVT